MTYSILTLTDDNKLTVHKDGYKNARTVSIARTHLVKKVGHTNFFEMPTHVTKRMIERYNKGEITFDSETREFVDTLGEIKEISENIWTYVVKGASKNIRESWTRIAIKMYGARSVYARANKEGISLCA